MSRILIIEDDIPIRDELAQLLQNAGYETVIISDFFDPVPDVLSAGADLILLDINLPCINGELLLREIRKNTDIPVIMVTSRTNELDEVLSMSYGADDYITKPYNPTILLLRISAVLKRSSGTQHSLSYHGLSVDTAKGCISGNGKEILLTKNEMIIFRTLLDSQGKIVSREQLMTALWDNDEYINDNALTVNISRLRSKLFEIGCTDAIETRKKQGYVLL
jgi:DNA-binding response OmpR family regulator